MGLGLGPPGPVQERQPAGGASQAARGVGPGRTPPDHRSIRELRTGSPLLRLSFGTGSSPTCQRRAASPPGAIPLLGFNLPAMAPPPPSEQPDAAAPGAGAISRVLIVMGNNSSPPPAPPPSISYGCSVTSPRFAHSAAVRFFARVSLQRWRRRRRRSSTSSSSSRRPPANPCRCPPSPFFSLSLLVLFICLRLVLCPECDFIGLGRFRTVEGFSFCPFLLRGE